MPHEKNYNLELFDREFSSSDRKKETSVIAEVCRQERSALVLGMIFIVIYGSGKAIQNFIPKWLIDTLGNAHDSTMEERLYGTLTVVFIFLGSALLFRMLSFHLGYRIMSRFRERLIHRLRCKILASCLLTAPEQTGSFDQGSINNLMFGSSMQSIALFLRQITTFAPGALVTVVFTLALFQSWDWMISGTLLGTCLLSVSLMRHTAKKSKVIGEAHQDLESSVSAQVNDYLKGMKTLKANRIEHYVFDNVAPGFYRLQEISNSKDIELHKEWMKQEAVSYFCYALLMSVAALRYFNDDIGLGVVAACLAAYVALQVPMETIFQTVSLGGLALAGLRKISALAPTGSSPPATSVPESNTEKIIPGIEFCGVNFSYDDGTALLRELNFQIPTGQKVAILGPSGSGKTTIIELIFGLLSPCSGSVKLSGRDIAEIDQKQMKSSLSLVPQEPFLFSATLRQNIILDNINVTQAQLDTAVHASCVDEYSSVFPLGIDTPIGADGRQLSGGERQRVAIARGLLKDTPTIIFDESTSALDNETQERILGLITKLYPSKTIIMVTHRLETLKHFDRALVICSGKIIRDISPAKDALKSEN